MGVLYRFFLVMGVPADGLADESGRSLLELAKASAAKEYEEEADQDVAGHLDDLVPAPLRVYEGGAWVYGGERTFVVGKAVLELEEVKGLLGWDVAGPVGEEAFAAARREVAEALAGVRGAGDPRAIMVGETY